MCSFITQLNATDVANFEGACNWHADCRNVHQSGCLWIECSFLYHKPSPKAFQRIWQYIQSASQPKTCNHTSPGPPHPASSPPRSSETATWTAAATISFHNQRIFAQTVRNRLREAHLHSRHPHRGLGLTWVGKCSHWWRLALWRGFSSRMNPGFHCTGQMADSVYGDVWVSGLLMSTLWFEWPMVAVGLWYGQAYVMDNEHRCFYWWHFEQRYRDEILRLIVVPSIHDHHLILQHDTAKPHVARICTTIHGSWKHPSSCMASILTGHVTHWAGLGCSGSAYTTACFQFLPISSNFTQPLKRSGPTFQRPQSTSWSTLSEGDVLHCVKQIVVHTRY